MFLRVWRGSATAPWSSAVLLSAQEGKVTFCALVGVVTLLATLRHTWGEKTCQWDFAHRRNELNLIMVSNRLLRNPPL